MIDPLRVSYSAAKAWRKCQQLYTYRYIERLQPKIRDSAPELGTVLHGYFDIYYSTMKNGTHALASHVIASKDLAKRGREVRKLAKTAAMLGADNVARGLRAIVPNALVLAQAYHRVHKDADAKHQVLLVEEEFEVPVKSGIVLPGRIDLVTQTGKDIWLWEHKTTGSIPENSYRFSDLQTLLYSVAVEELLGKPVNGVIWNYVRTTPPHPPALLKNGTLSTAKNQVTTLDQFLATIKENGLSLAGYAPYLRSIEHRERRDMFPRYQLPILGSPKILLRDYVATVQEIEAARNREKFRPVRNIDTHCGWCSFKPLCAAAVTGGTTRELKDRLFVEEPSKSKKERR